MRHRCSNPNMPYFSHYGGRGIAVCEEWFHSFPTFLHDMGKKPKDHTLDRIDNDGNYEPSNCRWANKHDQNVNRRYLGRKLHTMDGKSQRAGKWAKEYNKDRRVICMRTNNGWTIEEALDLVPRRPRKERTYLAGTASPSPITYNGETKSRAVWAEQHDIKLPTFYHRLREAGDVIDEWVLRPVTDRTSRAAWLAKQK